MDHRLPSGSEKFHLAPPDNQPRLNQVKTESRPGTELKDRKLQKADREKLRRDRLNDQFNELGKTLDPERPKFDKATILGDTIQMLNDLTAQVNRLKSEYTALTEESRELTQEKYDLREEKATLKSDIENLNLQYQQRVRGMYQSVVMHPYPVPLQMPMPPGTITMHPPYPFFDTQNPSTFFPPPSGRSHVSGSRNKSSESGTRKDEDSNEVATELELKTPGSTCDQDGSSGQLKTKKSSHSKENTISDGCSSSGTVQLSSSNSVIGGANNNNN